MSEGRRTLLLATGNRGKVAELQRLIDDARLTLVVLGLGDLETPPPEVVEDAPTFEGNARKKAGELAHSAGRWTLADDSGLEVDALGGAPGVLSARYAGVHGEDDANNAKLLKALEEVEARQARFHCALALADPEGRVLHVEHGTCEGRIGTPPEVPRGTGGFGYDPLFLPEAAPARTLAELSAREKNAISHRGVAARRMLDRLRVLICG